MLAGTPDWSERQTANGAYAETYDSVGVLPKMDALDRSNANMSHDLIYRMMSETSAVCTTR